MKFADYKAFEMTADAVEKDMENFDRIAKTADAMRLDHAQFEAWAKRHHYDLTRCSHEPYSAYRSDLTNAALAGWRGANGDPIAQAPIYQVWIEETSSYADVTPEYYAERLPSNRRKVYAAPVAPQAAGDAEFKNFHRLLCDRFGYVHDEKDWKRDQLSLIERISNWRDQFEYLDVQNHTARAAMRKIMARLTELLDEDRFAEIEGIVRGAGVEPPDASTSPAQPDERAAFEWPLLPAFPPAMWTVGKTGFFTEHQMQGYANAYGELVRAATAPQSERYQQLLGVAYVVLGCLVANGVDIPVRFLDAFADPDSVENPLELLPCDFSPARAVRAAVEAAALTDERILGEFTRRSVHVYDEDGEVKPLGNAVLQAVRAILAAPKEGS